MPISQILQQLAETLRSAREDNQPDWPMILQEIKDQVNEGLHTLAREATARHAEDLLASLV